MQIRTLESKSLPNRDPIANFPNGVTIRARKIAEIRNILPFSYISENKKISENLLVFRDLQELALSSSAAEGTRTPTP